MKRTSEQQAILEQPPTSTIKVAAGAGCGKTSTLIEYGLRWPARGLYLAFNRSIADEARRKFPSSIETRTAHSFAYRALDIGKRGNLINKFKLEHLDDYADMIGDVDGMTYGQVRSAILRTIDNFLIDAGTKLHPHHCPLEDVTKRNAIPDEHSPGFQLFNELSPPDRGSLGMRRADAGGPASSVPCIVTSAKAEQLNAVLAARGLAYKFI